MCRASSETDTTVALRFSADTAMPAEHPPARAIRHRRKSHTELKRDQQRAVARHQHTRQLGDRVRSSGFDTHDKQEAVCMADPEPVLFYSPHQTPGTLTNSTLRRTRAGRLVIVVRNQICVAWIYQRLQTLLLSPCKIMRTKGKPLLRSGRMTERRH